MLLLSDYKILEKISRYSDIQVFRAERQSDKRKVLLKITEENSSIDNNVYPIGDEMAISNTYQIKGLAHIIQVEPYHNRHIVVMEDIEGITLEKYLLEHEVNMESAIKIIIGITEVLQLFSDNGFIHRELTPAHLLINPKNCEISFIEFSMVTTDVNLGRRGDEIFIRKGALSYISPEQTGRIYSDTDIRSDFYSLGAIFYQLVTGKTPFEAEDDLALIHCHIAKDPVPPHSLNVSISITISKIIIKLLSKNKDERYQSTYGLLADLKNCLLQITTHGSIHPFEICKYDFSGKLYSSKKFFGRENEVESLLEAYNQVGSGEVQVILIEGYSGVGKSTLVQQLREVARLDGRIYIESKFDQFHTNIPYYGFIHAIEGFINYILAQDVGIVEVWRHKILEAVGINGQVLIDVVPHLELLIGTQQAVPEVEPTETQNRFDYVFTNFIKSICQKDFPLIIFFDDLQWSDAASSNLLKTITKNKSLQSLLFIGAYRKNELIDNSSICAAIEGIQKEGCIIRKILLTPLPLKNAQEIIYERLKYDSKNEKELIDLVYKKSQGNPFFINVILNWLYTENILHFNFTGFHWDWDPSEVSLLKLNENIVELMAHKIQKLPEKTQNTLKLAACLGYQVDLYLLSVLLDTQSVDIENLMKPAVQEDLVFIDERSFRFTHDRIQQAAYSLIPSSEKKNIHLGIGNALVDKIGKSIINNYIFEIAHQLTLGIDWTEKRKQREDFAILFLDACIKAKNSAAYRSSLEYVRSGIAILTNDIWQENYPLALQFYTEAAESAFLSSQYELMEEWIEVVLMNAVTVLDKVKVYEIRIKSFTAQHKLFDAVQTSLEVLQLLKIVFPSKPHKFHVLFALFKVQLALKGRSIERLNDLPSMSNSEAEAGTRLLVSVGSAVYFAKPALLPLFATKAFYLLIRYGNSPYSGVACSAYALIIIAGLRELTAGSRLGRLAQRLSEKFEGSSLKCQTRMMYNSYVAHLTIPLKSTLEPLYNNYWYGLENGNIEFASYSAYIYCYSAFFCGKNLKDVKEESIKFYERLQFLKHESAFYMHKIFTQAVINLHETVSDPIRLNGRIHNEAEISPHYEETETAVCILHLYKTVLSFLFENPVEGLKNAKETEIRLESLAGSSQIPIFYFYDSLIKLSLLSGEREANKKHQLSSVNRNIKILKKYAKVGPSNCLHKLLLVRAELNRVLGKIERASTLYDQAINEAQDNEYINELALICELAGKFYLHHNRHVMAQHYLLQAYKFYQQWGAVSKLKYMKDKYVDLFEKEEFETALESLPTIVDESKTQSPYKFNSRVLDLHSIIKSATAISSEVQLEKLLRKLIKIAVENAGAQYGYLILKKEQGFFIEAQGSISADEEVILESLPLKGNKIISESIIHYTALTKNKFVLEDTFLSTHFSSDPVLKKQNLKSVLCIPIIHQRDIIGLLYFENNLIANAFTEDRIEVIELLSAQIAISLQNALNEQKKVIAFEERENLLKKINLHQQELLKTKLEIQEQTYHNMSLELHDNIGQILTLIKLNINTIDLNSPEEALDKISESKKLLSKVIQDLRDLSKTLNADFLEKIGLSDAIAQQLQFLNRTGLFKTQIRVQGTVTKLDAQREILLFRVIQEILNNILKHSGASVINVIMEYSRESLTIEIGDNGKGFKVDDQRLQANAGLGIRNIFNRLTLIQGKIDFISGSGEGTIVRIEIPLGNWSYSDEQSTLESKIG